LLAINMRDSRNLGSVEYASLARIDDRVATSLRCERIHFAAGRGVCLSRKASILSAETTATIVDESFAPLFQVRADGIPSRARVSPDGRYAAFTVFVTGHSYGDPQLSTATLLIDLVERSSVGNLEEFVVEQDGRPITSPNVNYWGVTFERDGNYFYATLRTGGMEYLVRGDIGGRRLTVLRAGVECPSLSPDGTRIAFKKRVSRNEWRLSVLDVATLNDHPLAELRSVDDQAEWLDDQRVLYAIPDPVPWMTVMALPADGAGSPSVFAKGAASPAVMTSFRR
jgi:dipeptidyl aminopeptidase/acylaminoacyl peptidase